MRSKRDIKMGRLCTRGGQSSELSELLNGDAVPNKNMPFFVRLYALVVPLKTVPDFRL